MTTQHDDLQKRQLLNLAKKPAVSVVICVYNAAPFIAETLDSLFAQTFSDYEVIVVNDGSTDETAMALRPYLSQIIYHEQPNKGPAAARNVALRWARGEYVAILDSDDLWLPHYLETMVGYLRAHPDVDLVYPNALLFGDTHLNGKRYQDIYPSSHPFTIEKFLTRQCSVFGLVTFKRAILERVGMYDEELRGVEDLDLWLRMLQQGVQFSFTTEVLVKYRRHPSSLSSASGNYYQQVIKALGKFQNARHTTPHQRELAGLFQRQVEAERDLLLAKKEILVGNELVAAQHLLNVLAVRPSLKTKAVLIGLLFFPKLIAQYLQRSVRPPHMGRHQLPQTVLTAGL